MRQLLTTFLFVAVALGCQKNETTATEDPVASFTIKNYVEAGTVMEATALEFENSSRNADSYEWDFGNGTVSTERTPSGVMFRQCPRVETIRLTVRGRGGRIAIFTQTIRVRCR